MSDDLDMAAESAEAAQGAVQDDVPSTEAPAPWGEDFNAERAWNTITHLRGLEKELEPDAKAYKRLSAGEDPDTFRQLAEAYGFELPADEPDDTDIEQFGQDPYEPRISRIEQLLQEREAREQADAFQRHLDQLASDAELTLTNAQRKWVAREALDNGLTPEATEQAFKELREELEGFGKSYLEKYKGSKKAPHVAKSGSAATQVPDLDNERDRQEWMLQQLAVRQSP